MSEKKYPIGGYAPGSYHCHCATCGGGFVGDKRSYQCEPCALNDRAKFDALSPSEQEALVKRNAAAIQEAFKDWGKKPDLNLSIVGHGPVKPEIKQPSAVWVKASSFAYVAGDTYHAKDANTKGAGRFDAAGNFTWGHGSYRPNYALDDLLILDESPAEQPVREVDNDMFKFTEWCHENAVAQYENEKFHSWRLFGPNADDKDYTTVQIYQLFKEQKEK